MQPQAQAHQSLPRAYIQADFHRLFVEVQTKEGQARNRAMFAMQNTLNTLHGMDNLFREHRNEPHETGGTARGIPTTHWYRWFREELDGIYEEVCIEES